MLDMEREVCPVAAMAECCYGDLFGRLGGDVVGRLWELAPLVVLTPEVPAGVDDLDVVLVD